MSFEDGRFRNSWAVVYIDGNWRFVDCHWGARHVNHPDLSRGPSSVRYELDEFFFLTDPEDYIHMHLPDDEDWQMLSNPINLEKFVSLPVLKSHFFNYGLRFASKEEAEIQSQTGQVEVILKKCKKIPLSFNTRLEREGEELEGYCIYHCQAKEVIFSLGLPDKGTYFLTIFACDTDKSRTYNNVCSLRVTCSNVTTKPFCKLPQLPDGYGPTPLAEELGLTAEKFSEYYLVCNDDKMILNLRFRCPVRISQKLAKGSLLDTQDIAPSVLDRMVFQRFKDHTFVSYLLRFPSRGIYVFSIFAGYRDSKSQSLDCACRYLIQCNKKSNVPPRPYPKTLQYWHKCRLHEPTCGDLKVNRNVKFKVEVANAEALAVIVGQQWHYLQRDDSGKVWEGVAHTGKDDKLTLDVYCRYKDNDRDFFPLLEYALTKLE